MFFIFLSNSLFFFLFLFFLLFYMSLRAVELCMCARGCVCVRGFSFMFCTVLVCFVFLSSILFPHLICLIYPTEHYSWGGGGPLLRVFNFKFIAAFSPAHSPLCGPSLYAIFLSVLFMLYASRLLTTQMLVFVLILCLF